MSTVSRVSDENEDPLPLNNDFANRCISDEERKYGEIPRHIYQLYLKACGRRTVCIFFLSALGWQLLRVYTDVWLKNWSNEDDTQADIHYYFKVYTLLSVLCLIVAIISTPSGQLAGARARKAIYENLTATMLKNSLFYFQINPIGRIMNRFSNDTSVIDKVS